MREAVGSFKNHGVVPAYLRFLNSRTSLQSNSKTCNISGLKQELGLFYDTDAHILAEWPWANPFSSPDPALLIYKMGMLTITISWEFP